MISLLLEILEIHYKNSPVVSQIGFTYDKHHDESE